MKRLLSSAALFLCSLMTFAQFSGTGSGTNSDPYRIFNEIQLSQMANFLNQDGVVFQLMNNLDLTDWINENSPQEGWQPIGVASSPFKGILKGNNKTISGLSITRSSTSYVGFFGYLSGATIENLTIKGSSIKGANYVGTLTGYASNSILTNVNIEMTGSVTGSNYVGGCAGHTIDGSTITNLASIVTGGVSGTSYVGGLIGNINNTSVTTFSTNANVSGSSEVGGAFGYIYYKSVTDGTIIGTITASNQKVGGVAYYASGCSLKNITMKGNVSCPGTGGIVGGILGRGLGTLTLINLAHVGDVYGKTLVSGCVALLSSGSSATFTSCTSKGKITNEGDYTGGIVAQSSDFNIAGMNGCSHFGDISGQNYVGGIVGASLAETESFPTLHTYKVYYSNNLSSTSQYSGTNYTITESITDSSSIPLITNCTAIGNIQGNDWVGGLVGSEVPKTGYKSEAKTTTMGNTGYQYNFLWRDGEYTGTYTSNKTQITFTYYDYTRVRAGLNLTNNYFSGSIKGADHVGGIAGLKTSGEISCNYAYANISGASNVGGIIGRVSKESPFQMTLKSNVAICSYLSASGNGIGRIYGSLEDAASVTIGAVGSTDGNRALTQCKIIRQGVAQTIEDNLQNGISIGPSLLRLKATYVSMGWDFDNNWKNLETESYPYKKYQAAPPIIESDLVSQSTSISGKSVDGGTVYLFYKDHEAVSTDCVSNQWSITTEPLQSGAQVQIYADVAGLTPSYFTSANVGYPGSGTEDDPYRIYTAEDLQGAYNMGYYKVMNDIDLTAWIAENSPVKGWLPVGLNSGDATYIDGGGHKITGLWINTTENYTGLFSNFSTGEIKNLTVEVASGKSVKGGDYTGILIGRMANGSIVNCQVKGDVIGTSRVGGVSGNTNKTTLSALSFEGTVSGTIGVGGIVGYASTCPATNCNANGTVNATSGRAYIGGLIGYYTNSTISKSMANVSVTATGETSYVGGLVGYLSSSDVQQSLSKGSVTSTGTGGPTGGLVGYSLGGCEISECYSSANTSGTNYTAGLVGYSQSGSITNCYSTGNVIGTEYTAGLVAYANNCSIDKCYAMGNVTGEQYGAGVVGELDGQSAQLTNSVAANNIISLSAQSSWGSRVIGGYKNDAADPEESNYALATMQVSLNNVPQRKTDDLVEGIAKSETELMTAATYQVLGWDFTSLWGIDEGESYPYLSWTNLPSPNFITFADDNVKALCVANWDSNHDGELSMEEAAAVTDLGEVFKGNEEITSFDELQYFTGLTSIGDHAFNNCHSLQSVIIPENVTSIGQETFSGSYQLNSVNIPYTVTSIGMWAFNYGAFQQITIPSSVTSIGEYAFDNCNRLTSIIVEWEEPLAVPENIFENINYNNAVLYVPEESKASYKSADVWKEFFFDGDDREEYNAKRLLRELIANMEAIGGYELDEAKATVDNAIAPKEDYESAIALLQQQIKNHCANAGEGDLPVDATGLITNPSFTFDTASYWQGDTPQFQTWNNAEFYMTTFDIYQELAGLPNGRYMLKVKGFHRPGYNQDVYSDFQQGTDNASALLYANNESVVLSNHAAFAQDEQIEGWSGVEVNHNGTTQYVPDSMHDAYMWLNNGYYENELPVTVTDGILRVGIRLDESIDHGWVIFDDFRLEYLGSDSDNNIEYTDLSKYDNVIYVEEQTLATDVQTTTLSVKMNNEMGVRGFQFDLILPEGMTVAQDEDGFYMAELSTERTTTRKMNVFDTEMLEDGSLRVLCNSSGGYTFDGNEGEVCTITIHVGEQEGGEYPIIVKNIVFTDVSAIRHPLDDAIITKLTISDFTPGDVNNDTFVDVADLALVCNYILERDMEVFIFKAADMNKDNIVDVSDLAGVCNIILHREMSNSPMAKAPSVSSANITIEASSSSVLPGGKAVMSIILNNPSDEVSSLQMDLLVPKGFRVTDISMSNDRRSNQYVEYEAIGDHKVRVLCVSPNNCPLKGFDGAVLMVEMEASRALNEGSYPLVICNTILTSYGNRMTTSEMTSMMEVGNATAITEWEADGYSNSNIYSINGSRLNQPQRGVNIMRDNKGNAHKIIKKK